MKNPDSGISLLLGYETGSDKIYDNLSYNRFKLQFKSYFRITPRHILAIRILGERITGSYPNNYLLTLGGLTNLKSYYEDELLGTEKVVVNIEDRFLMFDNIGGFLWLATLDKVQMVPGFDLGKFTDHEFDYKSDFYCGFRFHHR